MSRIEEFDLSAQEESSNELVAKWRRGIDPEESFQRLFERYYSTVRNFFLARRFLWEESLDLTQETFLRAYKGIASLKEGTDFGLWIFQIALNVWRNELRARNSLKRDAIEVPLALASSSSTDTTPAPASSERDPLSELLHGESAERLRRAFDKLPPQMRRSILLRVHQGLKYREIAVLMGISIDTVKAHLYQARQRLIHEMSDHFDEPGA